MASIVTFLQNELLSLSNEAKKRYPDINDASERVSLILRPLKDRPMTDICAELAKSDEIMTPFVLACETKQPKLVSIAVGGLQRLVSHKAIADNEATLRRLIHALADVTSVSLDVQVKALQLLLPLITQYENLHMDLVAQTLNICFRLSAIKDPLVSNTAAATLRQLVIFLFDKVPVEDGLETSLAADLGRVKLAPASLDSLRPCARDAYLVFVDLCNLASGLDVTFLGVSSIPRTQSLELLESILSNHATVFQRHIEFSTVLSQVVCPMAIKTFSDRWDFAHSVRLNRIMSILVQQFADVLVMECEVFLSLFLKAAVDADQVWASALALEVFAAVTGQPKLVYALFEMYDNQGQSTKVVRDMVAGLHKIVTSGSAVPAGGVVVKMQCIDQLDKADPPALSDDYLAYLATQCTFNLITSLSVLVSEPHAALLVNSVWSALLAIMSHLLKTPVAIEAVPYLQSLIVVCGRVGCTAPRDAFLGLLCQVVSSVPTGDTMTPLSHACLQAVLTVALELLPSLDSGAWYMIFDVAHHGERVKPYRAGGGGGGTASVSGSPLVGNSGHLKRSGTPPVSSVAAASGFDVLDFDGQLKHLLSATRELPDEALTPVFSALCQFNSISTMAFAVDKLRDLVILHLHHLLTNLAELWTLVTQHFVFIASNTQSIELQLQACDTICHVAAQGITKSQSKVLAPLRELAALTGDVPKRALQTLHGILQVHGQSITEWPLVYAILQSSATEEYLVRVAFPSLELVCTEYLPTTNPEELDQCIATLRIYACQSVDVNIALTCIRLLWTIADSATARKTHWLTVLGQLTLIAKDRRPQVRNGCVASLFRAMASSGGRLLTDEQWDKCVAEIVMPVLETTLHCNDAAPAPAPGQVVHHARDSPEKQWDETRVMAVQGLGGLFGAEACKSMLPRHLPTILEMVTRYALETSLEVKAATAGVLKALAASRSLVGDKHVFALVYDTWSQVVTGLAGQDPNARPGMKKLSHDLLLTLVQVVRALPVPPMTLVTAPATAAAVTSSDPSGKQASPADLPEVFSRLECIVRMLALVGDHPNDSEHLSQVQSEALETAEVLRNAAGESSSTASTALMVGYLSRLAALPLAPSPAQAFKYPTFLALARTAMSRAVTLVTAGTTADPVTPKSPTWDDTVLSSLFAGLEPYLTASHPLHDHAVTCLLELVRHHFPTSLTLASPILASSKIQARVTQVVAAYLTSRPRAFESKEAADISALNVLTAHLPQHLSQADQVKFFEAVEASSRIVAPTILDATVNAAVDAMIAAAQARLDAAAVPLPETPNTPVKPQTLPAAPNTAPVSPSVPTTPLHPAISSTMSSPTFHAAASNSSSSSQRVPVRESYATHALGVVFHLAHEYPATGAPIAMSRARRVLSAYVEDVNRRHGIIPLARMRDVEVEQVLKHLTQMMEAGDESMSKSAAAELYPVLVDSIVALRENVGALEWVCTCLRKMGPSGGFSKPASGDSQKKPHSEPAARPVVDEGAGSHV
ncbi:guanine nucleotide exchange factor in Golgi transport N-terminal-domain-containing protein [Catenaria anguillulae PL171]|uniref:Guanine nucleotide exchange factor in Golgi transport N-terminal-domain-containing protein n=1 Tax=Catenaria anguillulae PL171 TaxID=765915 RepID=A0A1Y2H7D6_9FUNG|nr:guanine nucleotide exchange factor in Golgi transport N-terminal-domain-containing protein [Catenaria anguillulae PL171]